MKSKNKLTLLVAIMILGFAVLKAQSLKAYPVRAGPWPYPLPDKPRSFLPGPARASGLLTTRQNRQT